MKNVSYLLLLLLPFLLLNSCNKDDEGFNIYTYGSEETTLGNGYMKTFLKAFGDSFNHEIYLTPIDINYITAQDTFEGKGNILNFNLFLNNYDRPTLGEYNWSEEKEQFVLDNDKAYLKANIQNNAREVFSINKGKVIIGIKNKINTFHFEVDDVNGKEIKGSFKGILMRI